MRLSTFSSPLTAFLATLQLTSCTSSAPLQEHPASERSPASLVSFAQGDPYLREIQPIFSNRCVVCHTCVDAPCQLHLDKYSSVRRGATFSEMGSSLFEDNPTRPKDAQSIEEWREKGFFPLLTENNEPTTPSTAQQNLNNSLLFRFIEKGLTHNQPGFPLSALDAHRDDGDSCISNPSLFDDFIRKYPGAGMPYGLPALDNDSFERLKGWIARGAPGPSPETTAQIEKPSRPDLIEEWETTLNGTLKARISARYLYEHTFSAHLHFDETPDQEFFELVRSKTPFPLAVEELVTERPYDPPYKRGGPQGPVYYRFKKYNQTVVRKTHILWELNRSKLLAFKRNFLETPWSPQGDSAILPTDYTSINPFVYFRQIPAGIRYQFLLENSRLIVNAMVRGPVCTGRLATEAIRDHFWVFFLDPSSDVTVMDPTIGAFEWSSLDTKTKNLLKEKPLFYREAMQKLKPEGLSLDDLWKGDGTNPGALLTILRHETSSTVHYGPQSGRPDSVWLMNFSNFERIYYNLVVDFKPWGHELHKLATWNVMSLHRAEAEERFISLFPTTALREKVRTAWTHSLGVFERIFQKRFSDNIPSRVQIKEEAPFDSLIEQMLGKISPSSAATEESLTSFQSIQAKTPTEIRTVSEWEQGLLALTSRQEAPYAQYLPNIIFIRFMGQPYSIITNRIYSFHNIVLVMDLGREPERDTLSAFRGLYGDRPEIFVDLKPEQAANFLNDLQMVSSEMNWKALKEIYGIRRNDPRVWTLLDWFQSKDQQSHPLETGVFDMLNYDVD